MRIYRRDGSGFTYFYAQPVACFLSEPECIQVDNFRNPHPLHPDQVVPLFLRRRSSSAAIAWLSVCSIILFTEAITPTASTSTGMEPNVLQVSDVPH